MKKNQIARTLLTATLSALLLALSAFAYDDLFSTYPDYLYITGILGENPPETVVFPSEINGRAVARIQNVVEEDFSSLRYTELDLRGAKTVVFPENVDVDYSFIGKENLETVVLSSNAERINGYAFAGAANLKNINLENVKRISISAFENCSSLTAVNLSSAEYIAYNAFAGIENLTIYGVPGSYAEEYATKNGIPFKNAEQMASNPTIDVTATEDVEFSLYADELYITGIAAETVPETVIFPPKVDDITVTKVKNVRKEADGRLSVQPFDLRGTKTIVFSEWVKLACPFRGTENLEKVALSRYTKEIPASAFAGASKLTNINLESVRSIGDKAFENCTSLTAVNLANAKEIADTAFDGVENLTIYGYADSVAAEFAASKGYTFKTLMPKENCYDLLYRLGLLQGEGTDADGNPDFANGRAPTRAEAVVMLVRMLGKDKEAQAHAKTHPFTDVPEWADGYVSYAYEMGLVKGVSDTIFDAESDATHEMYLTYMLRVLGYTDTGDAPDFTYEDPWKLAMQKRLTERSGPWQKFLRGEMVDMTYQALNALMKDSDLRLYEMLIADGVFDRAAWDGVEV